MKTNIELYDDRPIENVLGTEMFRPEETVLICPQEVAEDKELHRSMRKYFEYRHIPVKLTFVAASLLDAAKVEKTLEKVLETHEDCAIDIAGGSEAALFAAGAISGDTPVYTYSRKRNMFFEIKNAPFARALPCTVRLNAESCFLMAGGTLLPGREDNEKLKNRLPQIDALFSVYASHRRIWNRQISYYQKISQSADPSLKAEGKRTGKADNGIVTADEGMLRDLEARYAKLLECGRIRLEPVVPQEEEQAPRIYMPTEKAEDLMSKNEEVRNLVVDLGLDIK